MQYKYEQNKVMEGLKQSCFSDFTMSEETFNFETLTGLKHCTERGSCLGWDELYFLYILCSRGELMKVSTVKKVIGPAHNGIKSPHGGNIRHCRWRLVSILKI